MRPDHEQYDLIRQNYRELKKEYNNIIEYLSSKGFLTQRVNTTVLKADEVFQEIFPFNSDLLFSGNLSRDLIIDVNNVKHDLGCGGAAFNSAFAASLDLTPPTKKVAMYSAVGKDCNLKEGCTVNTMQQWQNNMQVGEACNINKDYNVKKDCDLNKDRSLKKDCNVEELCLRGIDTSLVSIDQEHDSPIFQIGETSCAILTPNDHLEFGSLDDKEVYTKHLHICCRDSYSGNVKMLRNIVYRTFSIDTMSYVLNDELTFANFQNALEFKPEFVFCNAQEFEKLKEKLGEDFIERYQTTAIVTSSDKVSVVQHDNEPFDVIQANISSEKIKSTVGAGDVFQGAFLSQFIREKDIKECVIYGMSVASLSIQEVGVKHLEDKKETLKAMINKISKLNQNGRAKG